MTSSTGLYNPILVRISTLEAAYRKNPIMMFFERIGIAALLSVSLVGCVIVADHDWDGSDYNDDWQVRQQTNRDYIADLAIGAPVELIKADLGKADFSEAFSYSDQSILVLRYRTQHEKSDGETKNNETTPLIFVNGQLAGWGDRALEEYL